ncbi:hypothetical protein D3C87_277590 [compost metagenome]
MEKEKIISLIAEDMKHNQLLNGLESIGLSDNDRYVLSLDLFIAQLMGHDRGKIPDAWLDRYQQTMLTIPFNLTPKEIHRRAIILFESLSTI